MNLKHRNVPFQFWFETFSFCFQILMLDSDFNRLALSGWEAFLSLSLDLSQP